LPSKLQIDQYFLTFLTPYFMSNYSLKA